MAKRFFKITGIMLVVLFMVAHTSLGYAFAEDYTVELYDDTLDMLDEIEDARDTALSEDSSSDSLYIDLSYTADNGNTLIVRDEQNLFSDDEVKQFIEAASGVLEYGNVAIITTAAGDYVSEDNFDYEGNAKAMLEGYFGAGSDSTVFQICMKPRKITIWSEGAIFNKVDSGKALSITDNIYRQASGGYYYECAAKALKQEATLLSGGMIIEPMKYIGNFFLAFMIAILAVFALTFILQPKVSKEVIAGVSEAALAAIAAGIMFSFVNEQRIYDPVRDSDSGGGGSSGGGGGGGGGSHGF